MICKVIIRKKLLLALLVAVLAWQPASAIILLGLDNSANRTDPGTGVQFDAVGLISDSGKANPQGSAIHLGGGYMLTANHVGMKPYVTFDGNIFYERDLSYSPVQVASNVDLKIFKLSTTPMVGSVNLYGGSEESTAPATMVGWGVGRNPTVPVNSTSVTWGDSSTIDKRWGLNAPVAAGGVSYQSGSYQAIATVLGSSNGSPAGLGANEAAATLYDSGSALFQRIGGTWYLIGLTTAVERSGTSVFGNDMASDPNGDMNFFVRISTYQSQISALMPALIPEPSSTILMAVAFLLVMTRRSVVRH